MELGTLLSIPLKRVNQYEFWLELFFDAFETTDPEFSKLEDTLEAYSKLSEIVVKSNVKASEMAQLIVVRKKITGFEVKETKKKGEAKEEF